MTEANNFVDRMIGLLEILQTHQEDMKELSEQIKSAGLVPASIKKAAKLRMATQEKRNAASDEMRTTLALIE